MVFDYYGQYSGQVKSLLATALEPVERVANLPFQVHSWYLSSSTDQAELRNELLQLRSENLLLRNRLAHLDTTEHELERLQRLLGTTGRMANYDLQIASVIQFSITPITEYKTLNKGLINGVRLQQPVVDAEGVVGQISEVTPFKSRVLLISDPNHQISVRNIRTGARGILTGMGNGMTQLHFMPTNSSVRVDDLLVTSGLDGLFPSGYPVATIESVEQFPGESYLTIKARPLANLQHSYEVLIIERQKDD
ncbi:rod shape-determining protein MreC [Thiomicrospira aerophila AL3]|uniref:Cell shape-determining protein MreC n=2 Tax=Thiomicrospira aerophila TaxID=92245 RepID=W0DUW9_9GAMM|nr:rod shape-determining protein MreC [Thiomicrospira aerophila AL3]